MTNELRLNQLRSTIDTLEYPVESEAARDQLAGITLLYADGQEPLVDVISRTNVDVFQDVDDLESEIYTYLPIEAVGEPGQSDGDA
jgi:hypothetical protein